MSRIPLNPSLARVRVAYTDYRALSTVSALASLVPRAMGTTVSALAPLAHRVMGITVSALASLARRVVSTTVSQLASLAPRVSGVVGIH